LVGSFAVDNTIYLTKKLPGQGLFPAAAAAKDADELWGLFGTEEILEVTIQHTNRRVNKMIEQMDPQLLANDSGLGPIDMVC
jgi:hypothetical protein